VLNITHSIHILERIMNGIRRVCMQDFYRCEVGFEGRADVVATNACRKLVTDLHHEARVQAVITYHASVLGQKVNKKDARTIYLTEEQYLQVNTEY
jgi:hypothetical protein